MKIVKSIVLILLLIVSITACTNTEGGASKINENTKEISSDKINKNIYKDEELNEIINFTGTIDELMSKYQNQYTKEFDNGYQIVYYGESSVAIIWLDTNDEILMSKIYPCTQSKSEYDNLKIGESLEKVQSLFPKDEYLFLHTGRNDIPRVSTHYTKDKYVIYITYDDNNLITNIQLETIK